MGPCEPVAFRLTQIAKVSRPPIRYSMLKCTNHNQLFSRDHQAAFLLAGSISCFLSGIEMLIHRI